MGGKGKGKARVAFADSPYFKFVGMTFMAVLRAFIYNNNRDYSGDDSTFKDMRVLTGPLKVDIFVPADCKEWRWTAVRSEVKGMGHATHFQGRYHWKCVLPSASASSLGLGGLGRMRIDGDPQ